MSFLGGGAECSSAGNPLSQFHKHVQDDQTLQRDRLVGRAPAGHLGGFRSQPAGAAQDEMLDGFLNGVPGLQYDLPIPCGLSVQQPSMRTASASPSWARDFNKQAGMESPFAPLPGTHFSSEEFARFSKMNAQASSTRSSPMQSAVAGQIPHHQPVLGVDMMKMGGVMGYGMAGQIPHHQPVLGVDMMKMGGVMGYGMAGQSVFQPIYANHRPDQLQAEGKGKGKLVELDDSKWDEQFARLEMWDKEGETAGQPQTNEADVAEREFDEIDREMQSETNEFGDFESIWKGIQAEASEARSMQDNRRLFADMDSGGWNDPEWLQHFDGISGDWARLGDSVVERYLFESDNIFSDEKNAYEQGVRIMSEGGNLSLAALAFEAAVLQDPKHVAAWVHLGHAQAQNEKETAAIRAMEAALKLDPGNLEALMGLAVSYTNEGYDSTAYQTLERWLSVKYPGILDPKDTHSPGNMGFTDRQLLHDKVTGLFIKAAQLSPDGEHMDPDVQVGLGVLFYGAEEYDKAVDCFQSALQSSELGTSNQQQQLHLLWNRLGATLANSGRPEEAIAAYEKALSLSPNFVRARYNLGVSCININCHQEAACHFLAALAMHKSIEKSGRAHAYEMLGDGATPLIDETLDRMSAQNQSSTLYDTLRRVFTQMGRRDLADKTVPGLDPDTFRPEFDF